MVASTHLIRRGASLLANLGLALASVVLFFGVAELLARRWYPPPVKRGLYEPDRQKVFRHRANVRGVTNSFGHHDTEIPVAKKEGAVRIVALGDSITFGVNVPMQRTYPQVLERRLRRALPGRDVDVINTGMSGNTAFQEYVDLERALPFEPDAVVLQFTLNDVTEPYQVLRRYGGSGEDYHGVQVSYLHYQLSQRFAFYRAMRKVLARFRFGTTTRTEVAEKAKEREIYAAHELVAHPDDPRLEEAWREYLSSLQRIVDLAESRSIPLVVLASPYDFQLRQRPSRAEPQARLREFARERELPYVDLLACLQEDLLASLRSEGLKVRGTTPEQSIPFVNKHYPRRPAKFWRGYFLDYDHYNVEGHRYVAERLLPVLFDTLRRKRPELAPQLQAASERRERAEEARRLRAEQEARARADGTGAPELPAASPAPPPDP